LILSPPKADEKQALLIAKKQALLIAKKQALLIAKKQALLIASEARNKQSLYIFLQKIFSVAILLVNSG